MRAPAVTFDFGQTLTELDCEFLSSRLSERGIASQATDLEASLPKAWARYDQQCQGPQGGHPWHVLMQCLLEDSGVAPDCIDDAVQWLWSEQPKVNLWRKPILGMIEVVRRVAKTGTKVAVISNSEGRLGQLALQLGWENEFAVIADSGVLGFAKPGAQIFAWTAAALEVAPSELIHVGDSWAADVEGILGVGGRAVWFTGATIAPTQPARAEEGPDVRFAPSAEQLLEVLKCWGIPL